MHDFEIISHVENVRYTTDAFHPCQVALYLGDARLKLEPHTYYRSKVLKICEFAERCKLNGVQIKLIGNKFIHAEATGIEYANVNGYPNVPNGFQGNNFGFQGNDFGNGYGRFGRHF